MNITGTITGISYDALLPKELRKIDFNIFNINKAPIASIIVDMERAFAISKWVSPKRTRSYPYARIYNTLKNVRKITVIPIVKDEGAAGDRDFIQWDTISLMSLLDIFVILAYYDRAEKRGNKITNQQFNNEYVLSKIKKIGQYHSSALHWNLEQLGNIQTILEIVKTSYLLIGEMTGVKLHGIKGLEDFKHRIGADILLFKQFSRDKAEKAQAREVVTVQSRESLSTSTKSKITITNYLGGKYFFTVDEVRLIANQLELIEGKHSKSSLLPSISDIKDGLLKMVLYCNLANIKIGNKPVTTYTPLLLLTSEKLKGWISTNSIQSELDGFFQVNKFSKNKQFLVENLIKEAKLNKFTLVIKYSE